MNRNYPLILDELGRGAVTSLSAVSGGCISRAAVARFADGSHVFVKTVAPHARMFEREAEGLEALAAADEVRVPAVLHVSAETLVLEFIDEGVPGASFYERFGRKLARLHDHRGKTCGFAHDNFIGANPQLNQPLGGEWRNAAADEGGSWPEFFLERRLRFQAALAAEQGHGQELLSLLDRGSARIAELLSGAIEPSSLLHGDLWGGNFLTDESGEPCLIDPAVHYGHRESDLAMTRLFGGFGPDFHAAYEESLPLAAGHDERLPIYQLYHLLNHLNLFGRSYYSRCKQILQHCAS